MPLLDNRSATDFFLFREEDPAKAADLVVEIVAERIPRKFGLRPDEIQVLSPMHRAEVGVAALNTRLQEALNPPKPGLAERQMGGRPYRTGDRVMQIRNNYDKEVFNGDMGRILAVNLEDQTISVKMDERTVAYDFLEMDELVHAYAVSVHKAQGSEFPAVVIPLLTTHYMMLQRNLLYTAVTRAQKLVVLVGSPRAISIAVGNNRAKERYSGLANGCAGRSARCNAFNPATWKARARQLQAEVYALYLASRDPRVPWYAKAVAACVVGYALSPIDLIPDFIPVLGYLDDLVLIPLGIALALRMIPAAVMVECRARARAELADGKPVSRVAAAVIVAIWLGLAVLAGALIVDMRGR